MQDVYDVIIVGSGPAGLTAAIYTTRANLKTLIIAGVKWGGQLMLTTVVENFPGFTEGIQGPDLMLAMRKQAERHGATVLEANFKDADFTHSSPYKVHAEDGAQYLAKSVIIATGADTKWLNVKGEQEKIGRGVSSCAPCDAAFFREKNVVVVGGGDAAMEEALVLTHFAKQVTVVHRRSSLRASQIMQDKARKNGKIQFMFDTEVLEILGEQKVTGVKVKNTISKEISEMPIDGVFVAIGHTPNSAIFKGIEMDSMGYIKVQDHFRTNVDGVFVAGDVHDAQYRQAITAAGFGCAAALEAERWLRDQES